VLWGRGWTVTSTPAENAALVRRFLTDVVAGGDHDALDAFVTDDVVDHNLVFGDEEARNAGDVFGQSVLAAVGDVGVEIEEVVAADSIVAVRATVSGSYRRSLLDFAQTRPSFEIAYAWFYRIEDGRIAEVWSLPDGLGLVQQLDATPDRPLTDQPS
jgi:predicted ester cyclase